jgi:hypothetical protein
MKTKYFYSFLIGLTTFFQCSLSSVIFYEIDTMAPLSCSFSSNHPNRIMLEKGGIEKIIHSEPDRIQILIEEKANQAFIMAREEMRKPITLCVITTAGEVQDIEVIFHEQPSQLIVLQKGKSAIEECREDSTVTSSSQIQNTIDSILIGQIPPEFFQIDFAPETWSPRRNIQILEINRLDGEAELLRVFKISNCSRSRQTIHEKELALTNSSWVFLEKNCLLPGETTLAIVSIKRR